MFLISHLLVQARSKRESNVNDESRAKERADVLLLAFALHLPHSPKKGKKLVSN